MKRVFLSLAIAAIAFSANAQSKQFKFSAGVEAGLPLGDFDKTSSIGIGGSAQGEYAVAEKIGVTLSAGYLSFSGKSVDLGYGITTKWPTASIVPVLAGAKYYITESVYAQAQAGISFFNNDGGSAFTYAPGVGMLVAEKIDISLKYQAATKNSSTVAFLGLRAAYSF